MIPQWLRKTKIFNKFSKGLVNHLGLTLTKEDLQNVVDLMEPYGQISNGIEYLSPPLDVRNYYLQNAYYVIKAHLCHIHIFICLITEFVLSFFLNVVAA